MSKLTREDVRQVHSWRRAGKTIPQICREFRISGTQVGRILSGEQWNDVWLEFNDPQAWERWRLEQQGVIEPPQEFKDEVDAILFAALKQSPTNT